VRYMCLVHFDLSIMRNASLEAQQDLDRRSLAYNEELKRSGHYVISQAIQDPWSATLVRKRDGTLAATDGPYMETKEQMAGFLLIEARDMEEAVKIAARVPIAEIGTVEVRPIYDIPASPEL
jgi:hypothetical protein